MRPSLFAATILLALAPLGAPAAEDAALPPLDAATSLLVVSPHPDDETLCCAGVIQRVIRAGGRASVVWITSGDGERSSLWLGGDWFNRAAKARALGAQRMAEARAASTLLGVPPAAQLFLGYPDGGLRPLLTDHRTAPYESAFTRVAAVPYPDARFPGHPYTGESLERDFRAVLALVRPSLILAPSQRDTHPDHRAAGLLAMAASARYGAPLALRYWIVHDGEGWPSPRGLLAGVPLTPAACSRGLDPLPFVLYPAEEDRALLALQAHRTQMRVMEPFLLAFVRTTELFSARP
ncbi:MAG TPA: PIG-L family deacetylase [Steroidobacteraceae bacterium]|jgi:LmbE family N-acetylglucosaminyl deacetylase|nr:PIG-L family deacetylase [Steroidobacteraceae bacterium]